MKTRCHSLRLSGAISSRHFDWCITVLFTLSRVFVLTLLATTVACGAGDGTTLDKEGRYFAHPDASPLASKYGSITFEPRFTEISTRFFGSFCSCHLSPNPPKGLSLDGTDAYDLLVEVPSSGRSNRILVVPGSPDESYLIHKLEGEPDISGRQMPRNRPARPQSEIEILRAWIEEGAIRN
tara:strand:+ start:196 stop:738 length:543 start_codon:yes stop_codon:yes gene_type:complete